MISDLGDQIEFRQQAGAGASTSTISQLQSSVGSAKRGGTPMADLNSSLESSGLSGDEKSTTTASTSTAEAMMWEGWTSNSHPSSTDSASTSHNYINNNNINTIMGLQQFPHPSDMLCNMMSSFHPLSVHNAEAFPALDSNATVSFGSESSKYLSYAKPSPEIMKWDHASPHQEISLPWPGATSIHDEDPEQSSHMKTFFGQTSKKLELFPSFGNLADHHSEMNPALNQMPWTDAYESTTTRSQQVLNFVRTAQDQRLEVLNLARHRRGDEILNGPASKRRAQVEDGLKGNSPGFRRSPVMDSSCSVYSNYSSTSSPGVAAGSQAMEMFVPWPGATSIHDEDPEQSSHMKTFFGQTSKKLELFPSFGNLADHHSEMNPALNQMPWTDAYESTTTRSQQVLNFVRTAQDQRLEVLNLARHRRGDEILNGPASKRRAQVEDGLKGNSPGFRRSPVMDSSCSVYSNYSSTSSPGVAAGSQAMEMFAMGPALNTNGKPRARRGSATDPQSVYARHRREKINERLKTLQHLVPNGTKVDIVTMLDEAVHYVQFLQLQVKLLKSDKYWIHATPNIYKGMDLTNPPTQMQGLGSSA